jgi:uncharacterized membrane protein YfcA
MGGRYETGGAWTTSLAMNLLVAAGSDSVLEAIRLSATFLVSVLASFIGSIAGSGGLISIPFLILIGIPPQTAVATHRVGAVGLQIGALTRFATSEEIAWKHVAGLSGLALLASQVGSRLLLRTDQSTLEYIIVVVMLGMLPLVLMKRDLGLQIVETSWSRKVAGYALLFLVLVWQAYFGGAAATMTLYSLVFFFGTTFNGANATSKIPGLLLGLSTLLIFSAHGIVDWTYGITMFVGMLIGGYLGAHTALRKGNAWVKWLFVGVVLISAAKMVWDLSAG